MDTRKVTLVATIAVIALVAVGIGYAYTATTQNAGNSVSPEYITIVQGGTGAYQFSDGNTNIQWNTSDTKVASGYSTYPYITEFSTVTAMTAGAAADHMDDFKILQIGSSFTLVTKEEGITTPATLTCAVGATGTWNVYSGGDHPTTFFLKAVNNGITTWLKWDSTGNAFKLWDSTADEWSGDSTFSIAYDDNKAYHDTTISIYYAIQPSGATNVVKVEHDVGVSPVGPSSQPLNGAGLTFTITK